MTNSLPTLFLRLEGPLQAWGTTSRFSVRATERVPSKSGVIGLICSAMGLRRGQVEPWLEKISRLEMGVRIDRPGRVIMDYHTSGAGIGLMSAQGKIKITQSTHEVEAQVSRCYYLADASFLVALRGDLESINQVRGALLDPVWPPFLGRKSCPPSRPLVDHGSEPVPFESLAAALGCDSQPWQARTKEEREAELLGDDNKISLGAIIECDAAHPSATRVQDVPLSFAPQRHGYRFVVETTVDVVVEKVTQPEAPQWHPHTKPNERWQDSRKVRLKMDHDLCVFCKQPAEHVHHVTYENAPFEQAEDLRSVCSLCHAALTMMEYGEGRTRDRFDPCDCSLRERIIKAREAILKDSIPMRIRRRGD